MVSRKNVITAVKRCVTTTGFDARYLHSTGQLQKIGPDTGVFFQLTADDQIDPGAWRALQLECPETGAGIGRFPVTSETRPTSPAR